LFVKELTLKNQSTKFNGENHLVTASKDIKDLLKKVKDQEVAAENSQSKNGANADGHVEDL
jgi:hypothetical protein